MHEQEQIVDTLRDARGVFDILILKTRGVAIIPAGVGYGIGR
jgi:hypothetical protein